MCNQRPFYLVVVVVVVVVEASEVWSSRAIDSLHCIVPIWLSLPVGLQWLHLHIILHVQGLVSLYLGSRPRGLWVFRDLWRKRGQPRQPTFGERGPTDIAARSSSHSLSYAALRSD